MGIRRSVTSKFRAVANFAGSRYRQTVSDVRRDYSTSEGDTTVGPIVVRLYLATLPSVLRAVAVHHWFVVHDPATGRYDRWEVWQRPDAGGESWGHVHRNLMPFDRPVGGGPPAVAAEWHGAEAARLRALLEQPEAYSFRNCYRYWPGPNSNTYAAWNLARAGLLHDFDPRGVGKDFLGTYGFGLERRLGAVCVSSPLLGLRAGPLAGLELHLLSLTFGVSLRPFAVKTPLGSIRHRNVAFRSK
jgi:hypothetical protein